MGMYTTIKGIKGNSEQHKEQIEIYNLCKKLNISLPAELEEVFEDGVPEYGPLVDLPKESYEKIKEDMKEGYIIDITKLPENVIKIKFSNNY